MGFPRAAKYAAAWNLTGKRICEAGAELTRETLRRRYRGQSFQAVPTRRKSGKYTLAMRLMDRIGSICTQRMALLHFGTQPLDIFKYRF